jgi:hypothetical protein
MPWHIGRLQDRCCGTCIQNCCAYTSWRMQVHQSRCLSRSVIFKSAESGLVRPAAEGDQPECARHQEVACSWRPAFRYSACFAEESHGNRLNREGLLQLGSCCCTFYQHTRCPLQQNRLVVPNASQCGCMCNARPNPCPNQCLTAVCKTTLRRTTHALPVVMHYPALRSKRYHPWPPTDAPTSSLSVCSGIRYYRTANAITAMQHAKSCVIAVLRLHCRWRVRCSLCDTAWTRCTRFVQCARVDTQ